VLAKQTCRKPPGGLAGAARFVTQGGRGDIDECAVYIM